MATGPKRAAEYLRVSTDQQRYSLERQAAQLAAYAAAHGYEIVRTYEDDGVSGLKAANRKGLQRLLADVVGGEPGFEAVLIYDVSRWGRFQNPDEAAHYEFVCRQEGVDIVYCAEDLPEGGVAGALIKQVRRVMAAEYSRQLSKTVTAAQHHGAADGYWQGGPPGYGLRRCEVDPQGRRLAVLEAGQRKSVQGHKVIIVPGPPEELEVVARIYRLFLEGDVRPTQIVRILNEEGIPYAPGRAWTYQQVKNVLTNPLYAGLQTFGRTSQRMGGKSQRRPSSEWVIAPTEFAAVEPEVQVRVARRMQNRMLTLSDAEMLARLKGLLKAKRRLSSDIIKAADGVPSPHTYANRFGSLRAAYKLIGYDEKAPAARRGQAARNAGRARRAKDARP